MEKECLKCGNNFEVKNSEAKRGNGKFCSRSCASKYNVINRFSKINKPNVKCAYCDKMFYKNRSKIKRSKSGLFFCCREHKDKAQRIGGVSEIMPSHYREGQYSYRSLALNNKEAKCERCGWEKHIAGIVIHHKDRNRDNNVLENLEVLCACCHNIEHWS